MYPVHIILTSNHFPTQFSLETALWCCASTNILDKISMHGEKQSSSCWMLCYSSNNHFIRTTKYRISPSGVWPEYDSLDMISNMLDHCNCVVNCVAFHNNCGLISPLWHVLLQACSLKLQTKHKSILDDKIGAALTLHLPYNMFHCLSMSVNHTKLLDVCEYLLVCQWE